MISKYSPRISSTLFTYARHEEEHERPVRRRKQLQHGWREASNPLDALVSRVGMVAAAYLASARINWIDGRGHTDSGESEDELGTLVFQAVERKAASVGAGDPAGNVEAEAVTAGALAD